TPSPHDDLEPSASARIIVEHVTAGAELARQAGLPEAVIDFIWQHHGTTRVEYFFRQAVAELGLDGVDEAAFRYPGPRPQSRETALVMLADGSEASVRAAGPQSEAEIEQIVGGIIDRRLADGELDDCDLTLRDLQRIADSFVATLRSMYHPRIRYPNAVDGEPVRRRSRSV
ncbi:MAG: HD domain-containing protein, partial [Anaerolineae bacterium]